LKRSVVILLAFAAGFGGVSGISRAEAPGAALSPPSTGGLLALDPLLRKLSTHRRLIIIGAHPDDEDTSLLALVAKGLGGEAAYLSLSRGEGGQNLIGQELEVGLGLIRSQELQAARKLDGARQYFTRAYDFGYSRSLEETLRFWPKDALAEDAVRVVRRFRPQVVVSVFSGTAGDGHGQHQAAGVIAREAFRAAGDPSAFQQLFGEQLPLWQPAALYRSTRFERDATTITLPTGGVEPLTGRSYHQIAMASRSLHRSQDMGMLQPAGPNETRVAWVAGGTGVAAKDLFSGVDTRLRAIASELEDESRRVKVQAHLDLVEGLMTETRNRLSPAGLSAAVPPLASALTELRAARALFKPDPPLPEAGMAFLLDEKIAYAEAALTAAAGVAIDALSNRETASPGEALEITVQVWNAGEDSIEIEGVGLSSADGWSVPETPSPGRTLAAGSLGEWKLAATVSAKAPPTLPYFLYRPLAGALYGWGGVPFAGEPFQPGPLSAFVNLKIAGTPLRLAREAVYRYRDQASGEIRRPLRAVPHVNVAVAPALIVWPIGRKGRVRFQVSLVSNSSRPLKGRLEITPPKGWSPAAPLPFQIAERGGRQILEVGLDPPVRLAQARFEIPVAAVLENGERFEAGIRVIEYDHIEPTPIRDPSRVRFSSLDLRLPPVRRVGYIRGAADVVPEFLRMVGVPIEVLDGERLGRADLSLYDAIVVGSRAYETDPALATANSRLLDYVRDGGLLLVQYQQYAFVEGRFAPYKLEIARPHGRVTDESAAVSVLTPNHPVFTTPNRIAETDWSGWVQERGLYFAGSWDPAYTPLLAMADPGYPEQRGSLLAARLGKGHYIYTGLAFFRQIPAGVPGAYRLFANLLAWKPVTSR